jgi:carbamoylphosphate synthase large subunit
MRKIPHRLYMKSILTEETAFFPTSVDTLIKFVKRNKIDFWIPSDVTDTMFAAKFHDKISQALPSLKFAITHSLEVYEKLENKWDTFHMMKEFGIPTPETKLFDPKNVDYPFFLKVASGTNAGRGVWHCTCPKELQDALQAKEVTKRGKNVALLAQMPTYGEIICAEIIYQHGKPLGFFVSIFG